MTEVSAGQFSIWRAPLLYWLSKQFSSTTMLFRLLIPQKDRLFAYRRLPSWITTSSASWKREKDTSTQSPKGNTSIFRTVGGRSAKSAFS